MPVNAWSVCRAMVERRCLDSMTLQTQNQSIRLKLNDDIPLVAVCRPFCAPKRNFPLHSLMQAAFWRGIDECLGRPKPSLQPEL